MPPLYLKQRQRPMGISLLETLLVLTVIIIITLIAFPITKGLRERAQMVTCSSRLRTLFNAIKLYQIDHNGLLPPNKTDSPGITTSNCWITTIHPYLISQSLPPATVGPHVRAHLSCPSHTEPVATWAWWYSHYGVNAASNATFGYNGEPQRPQLEEPSKTMMLTETTSLARAIRPTANGLRLFDYRHQDQLHVLFFDGHIQLLSSDKIPTQALHIFWSGKQTP